MSHLTPVRITDKNGRLTTVHKNLDGKARSVSGQLNDSRPSLGGNTLNAQIQSLETAVDDRIFAGEFHDMLEYRDQLSERLGKIKESLRDARAKGDKIASREIGREHLAAYEELLVLKKNINDYKDETAPLVFLLEELRTKRDIANGTHLEYVGDTLGNCHKTVSFASGTREWLEQRQNGLGGSDIGAILKVGDRAYVQANYERVLKSKMEPISDEQVAAQALNNSEFKGALGRGNAWEEAIFRRFAENHPELLVMHNKDSWQSNDVEYGFANLDGLICDLDGNPSEILEIKTSSEASAWENGVPPGYRAQTLWYLRHFGLKRARVAVMIDDHDYREFVIEPEDGEMERNDKAAADFWAIVKSGVMPTKAPGRPQKGFPSDRKKADQYIRDAAAYRQESSEDTAERFKELLKGNTFSEAIEKLYREHDPSTRTKYTVSVDLETTSVAPETGRIIEIGMTKRDAHGNVVEVFESLFSVPSEILDIKGTGMVDVHQINPDDIRGKLPFEHESVQKKVMSMLEDSVLLAHNAGFEDRFLNQFLDDYAELDISIIDSVKLSKMFVPETPNNKLETLAPAMGVPYTNGHRALHDAEVNADAYFPLTQRIFSGK